MSGLLRFLFNVPLASNSSRSYHSLSLLLVLALERSGIGFWAMDTLVALGFLIVVVTGCSQVAMSSKFRAISWPTSSHTSRPDAD